MKLNLEIEIDWIGEDETLDGIVKQEIISGVMDKVSSKIIKDIEEKVKSKIDEIVISKVDELTTNMFNEFVDRSITVTDGYGDKLEVYDNLSALLKKRFDDFIVQKVDEKGNISNSSFGKKHRRIDFIIDKQLREFANTFTKESVDKVQKEIEVFVKQNLKDYIGDKMMDVLEIEKVLKIGKGK